MERQKLINKMLIVIGALCALNVSVELVRGLNLCPSRSDMTSGFGNTLCFIAAPEDPNATYSFPDHSVNFSGTISKPYNCDGKEEKIR